MNLKLRQHLDEIAEAERCRLAAAAEIERRRLAAIHAAAAQALEAARSLIYEECYREFSSEHARDQHFRDTHGFKCDYYNCGKIFNSQNGLHSHQNALNHW